MLTVNSDEVEHDNQDRVKEIGMGNLHQESALNSGSEWDPTRRTFLAGGALLGVAGLLALNGGGRHLFKAAVLEDEGLPDTPYPLNRPENQIFTVCLNCNTGCGIKVKFQDGVAVKIEGNPYSPWTLSPHLNMDIPLSTAVQIDGGICPKGQAGLQIAYDPYRIRKVLKRAGKRGENKWITIPFDQAITEIVEGGKLFAHVPGEDEREVEGLRSIMTLTDVQIASKMGEEVQKIWNEKDPEKRRAAVAKFREVFKENISALIDPEHPDLGPRNNQFVIAWGRLKGGRSDIIKRFGESFGTINLHGHTTVCQGALYFVCKAISEQYRKGKFSDGEKFYWQADTINARYILFVGANLFEANYGPTNRAMSLMKNITSGHTKIAVVDPRYSKLASKAHKWLPIKPGEDMALAMAIIRWMFDHKKYDAKFLGCANKAAARQQGELSWTNATWLVEVKEGVPGKFLRAEDIGLIKPDPDHPENKRLVVMVKGKPVPLDPNDDREPVVGDLFVKGVIKSSLDGKKLEVKSALQLLKEAASEKSFEDWCRICELNPPDVEEVARELTSYGKQAVVEIHRGVAQHTNGFYSVTAWMIINMLLGNFDWKGGMCLASTYKYDGKGGGPFDLTKNPGKIPSFGISIIRHGVSYENTTLFEGYPAKRNWYPLSSDVYQEIVPSIGEKYPYPIKALFLYMGAPTYALPGGQTNIEVLRDVEKLPLFFASDIHIGPTSQYADYIFPDLSYLERWEFHGSHPNIPYKVQPIRQPAIAPIPEIVKVFGEEMPCSLEALLLGLAEKLGLKGFGRDAFGKDLHFTRPEEYYLRGVVNLAVGDNVPVPELDPEEMEAFLAARRHLPSHVFNPERWRSIVGDEYWGRVTFLLSRGGRFEEFSASYKGDFLAHPYARLLCLYQEKTASYRHSGTGEPYRGIPQYTTQKTFAGKPLAHNHREESLHLITHRTITQTKSRTAVSRWLKVPMPNNGVLINPKDAARLGIQNGVQVALTSPSNPQGVWDLGYGRVRRIVGEAVLTETIRPGVVSFALGFGMWGSGADDLIIDGILVKKESHRSAGVHANAVMELDPDLRNTTCLIDPVGGSVSFYDSEVWLSKVEG